MKVLIIGVGNLAAGAVQAIEAMNDGDGDYFSFVPNLSWEKVEIVGAVDVDKKKVGQKLKDALFAPPNVASKFREVKVDVTVEPGVVKDDLGFLEPVIDPVTVSEEKFEDYIETLKPDLILLSTPSNMNKSNTFYAEVAARNGISLINTTPTPVAKEMGNKFGEKGTFVLGDDLLSQIGGTVFHEGLIEFLESRGVKVVRSYQVDIAGTTEALVTIQDDVKDVKKGIKSSFIRSRKDVEVVAGTSDYVQFLKDRRVSYIVIEGYYGAGAKVRVDVSLKTYDSQNAIVPVLDLLKVSARLKAKGTKGNVPEVSGFYFKSPPVTFKSLEEARKALEDFVKSL
ncbi:MAG: L-myo-inositol-1-phosphate synthase [Thermoprotei archaeon]